MVAPSGGAGGAHLQDVVNKFKYCGLRVAPYVVEDGEDVDVKLGFHWELSKKEVQTVDRGAVAEFEKAPEDFVLVWSDGEYMQPIEECRQVVGFLKMSLDY